MSKRDELPSDRPAPTDVSRRDFVTTVAGLGTAFMIVPRHVLGRGFQAPSDTVNVAIVGVGGMGAVNAAALMSQNIVAICDCDDSLLNGKLAQWTRAVRSPAGPRPSRQRSGGSICMRRPGSAWPARGDRSAISPASC